MRKLFVLLMILAAFGFAEDVHDFSNLDAVRVPDGTAALPGLLLQSEGEDDPEGEQEGIYRSAEGEGEGDGVGVSVDSVSVGVFRGDGLHGDVTGDVTGDITGDVIGDVTGDLTGEVIAADGSAADPSVSFGDTEGEGESGFYNLAEGEDGIGASVNGVSVGKIKSTGWNGAVVGNVTGNLTGDSAGAHTGAVSFPAGSAAAPSIYPTGDTNTGIYSGTGDTLYMATGGTLRLTLSTTAFTNALPYSFPLGAVGTPSLYPGTDTNTGIYSTGADALNIATNGVLRLTFGTAAITSTLPIVIPLGAVGTPSIYPTGDSNTGIYSTGADTLNLATGGVLRLTANTTALTSTLPYSFPLGSAAAPSLYPGTDTNTGIYSSGADTLNFATGGSQRIQLDSNGLLSLVDFNAFPGNDGSATSPQYLFGQTGSTNYGGIYCDSSGNIGIERAGVASVEYAASSSTMSATAVAYDQLHTNYYEGSAHNTDTYRAARGTSASPDYLDEDDILHGLKIEARDGSGTWGDGVELRAVATGDHASGETPSGLEIYTTPAGTDTQVMTARASVKIIAPSVYDIAAPALETRLISFEEYGCDYAFGYAGDIVSGLGSDAEGIMLLNPTTVVYPLLLGIDGRIYFGDGSSNANRDSTGIFSVGGTVGELTIGSYQSGAFAPEVYVHDAGIEVNAADAFYLGDATTDGSWRIIRDGNNLVHQRRESNIWQTKQTITP